MTNKIDNSEKDANTTMKLHGTAFKIYWYILVHGGSGIRQIQRDLGLSSSNLVTHHLKKLLSDELIYQNSSTNKYEVKTEIKTGILSLYTRIGNFLIPENIFLLVFFVTMTISYLTFVIIPRGFIIAEDFFFSALSIVGMIFFLRQTLKIWRLNPL